MGFLDSTGLSRLVSKLKSYFQEKLVSGTNIKTINSESIVGSGDLTIQSGTKLYLHSFTLWNGSIHFNVRFISTRSTADYTINDFYKVSPYATGISSTNILVAGESTGTVICCRWVIGPNGPGYSYAVLEITKGNSTYTVSSSWQLQSQTVTEL